MKTVAAILLLTATAYGQEGLDTELGTGAFPPGIVGETNLRNVQLLRCEALKSGVHELQSRYESGLDNIHFLLDAQMKLAAAQLDTTADRQQRLEYLQAAFNSALLTWQRVKKLQSVGMRGGDAAAEAQARAAVFRVRVAWLKEEAKGASNPSSSPAHRGLDPTIGTGAFPEGIAGVDDVKNVQLSRVAVLQSKVQAMQARHESGLDKIGLLLASQMELAVAQLDTTNDKQERLDHLQAAFHRALLTWQRIKELQNVGMVGGDVASEFQAREAVFKYYALWLKEKSKAGLKPTQPLRNEDLDLVIGTGDVPEGIEGANDIGNVQLSRIEVLQTTVEALHTRYQHGLVDLTFVLNSQLELAEAQLEIANDKQQRLAYSQAAFNSALLNWQRVKELQKHGMRGGDMAAESQARAEVLRFRILWLKERFHVEAKPIPQPLRSGATIPPNVELTLRCCAPRWEVCRWRPSHCRN